MTAILPLSPARTPSMPFRAPISVFTLACVINLASYDLNSAAEAIAANTATSERLTFEKHVRPVLKTHCFQCHGEETHLEGKLDLRLRRLILAGGDSGPGIVPGQPGESLLLKRIQAGEMPPNGKTIPAKDAALIERWIVAGAVTASDEPADVAAIGEITAEEKAYWAFQPVVRPSVPVIAQSADAANGMESRNTPFNPIDALILEKLSQKGLTFSPQAERPTLIRRMTYDLIGLPPTPAEIDEFENDLSVDAHERLVDRLLASPHYGERWGRNWLDVAGYADSEGYSEADPIRKYAYKYRDWVLRAFNSDMPFDDFIVDQLAGDELIRPPYINLSTAQQDHLIATGFLRTVVDGTGQGADPKIGRNAVVAETIKVTSTALLGLTVGCAECHNHRYDPIPQTDYYRMRAIFEPALNWKAWRGPAQRLISLYTDADRAAAAAIEVEAKAIMDEREKKLNAAIEVVFERELAKVPEEHREQVKAARNTNVKERTAEQVALLKQFPSADPKPGQIDLYDRAVSNDLKKDVERATEVRKKKPVEEFLSPLTEIPGQVPDTVVFFRGDPDQPKQKVSPGDLSVLDWLPPLTPAHSSSIPTSGRRLAYARHLTSGQHPLVSRVFVNRIWLAHFGRGLVATPGDFGVLGDRPTHPLLLDWLASVFVNSEGEFQGDGTHRTDTTNGTNKEVPADADLVMRRDGNPHRWSIKRLHRLMVNSAVYRQSSQRSAANDAIDPENRLLSRMSVRRLEAEAVRDAILSANGTLNDKLGGSPVPVMLDEDGQVVVGIENLNGENRPGAVIPLKGEEFRRSVYIMVRRSRLLAVLDTFDLPTLDPNCTSRTSSTVAPQSLMMMNSDFIVTAARQFAERLTEEGGTDPAGCVRYVWPLVFGRPPRGAELQSALQFIEDEQVRLSTAAETIADPKHKPDPVLWSWATFCQALFGSNEFLYID